MPSEIRQRESKLSILLTGDKEVHSTGCALRSLNTDREQESSLQLLRILLFPFMSIMHNPNSIKVAHRLQYCFLPLVDLHTTFSYSHNPKSILWWISRKKKWNDDLLRLFQWRMTVCDEGNANWIRGRGDRIALAMKGTCWNWSDNK